jgi:hypothetical protein
MTPFRPAFGPRSRAALTAAALVVLALSGLVARAHAGAWTLNKDTYYFETHGYYLSGDQFYDANGDKGTVSGGSSLRDLSFRLRSEYGTSDKLTLRLQLWTRFLKETADNLEHDPYNNGFGDANIALRYAIVRKPGSAVAVELDQTIPTGYSVVYGQPSLGRGIFSTTVRAYGGVTLAPTPIYLQGDFGYRKNFENHGRIYSPELVAHGDVGGWATEKLLLYGDFDWQKHTDDTKLYEDYLRAGGVAQYRLSKTVEVFGGWQQVLNGKNVQAGGGFRVGVVLKGGGLLGPYQGSEAKPFAEQSRAQKKAAAKPAAKPAEPAPAPTPSPAEPTPPPTPSPGTPEPPK